MWAVFSDYTLRYKVGTVHFLLDHSYKYQNIRLKSTPFREIKQKEFVEMGQSSFTSENDH